MEEEDLHVYLLLDASRSMDFGSPNKLEYARRVAAALGYVGLTNYDRVGAAVFNDRLPGRLAPVRGRAQGFTPLEFLQEAGPEAPTSFAHSLRALALRPG